jgi:hypothetical protein
MKIVALLELTLKRGKGSEPLSLALFCDSAKNEYSVDSLFDRID